jgi:hypothetical protein
MKKEEEEKEVAVMVACTITLPGIVDIYFSSILLLFFQRRTSHCVFITE